MRKIFIENDFLMIICMLNEQIQILLKLKFFELDMSFQKIKKIDFNEIVFAVYEKKQNKEKY